MLPVLEEDRQVELAAASSFCVPPLPGAGGVPGLPPNLLRAHATRPRGLFKSRHASLKAATALRRYQA